MPGTPASRVRYPRGGLNYCFLETVWCCAPAAPWILTTLCGGTASVHAHEGQRGSVPGSGCRVPNTVSLTPGSSLAPQSQPSKDAPAVWRMRGTHRLRLRDAHGTFLPSAWGCLHRSSLYVGPPRTLFFKFHLSPDEDMLP